MMNVSEILRISPSEIYNKADTRVVEEMGEVLDRIKKENYTRLGKQVRRQRQEHFEKAIKSAKNFFIEFDYIEDNGNNQLMESNGMLLN